VRGIPATCHLISAPQFEWGKKVLSGLSLRGHEGVNVFIEELAEQAASDDPPFELGYWCLNLAAQKSS